MAAKSKSGGIIVTLLKRWFIDSLGAMALGLFASLIVGVIISDLIGKIPGLGFIVDFLTVSGGNGAVKDLYLLGASSPVIGSAIGVAIAYGLKHKPLVIFSSAVTGALGYMASANNVAAGPVGAYLAALVSCELAGLYAGKTKLDILLVPLGAIISGALVANFAAPGVSAVMNGLGSFINSATEMQPFIMGIIISVVVGMALTAPISSAALCIMLNLDGLAAGAATVGCCANMIGFAVGSFKENGISGLISQGIGTSMLQVPNIVRRPIIWLPSIITSAILGPVSTCLLKMTNNSMGAGMGTSGLVGNINAYLSMTASGTAEWLAIIEIIIMHFILPGVIAWGITAFMRHKGWIRSNDMLLPSQD